MEAAYNHSLVHSGDLERYLDALRAGRDPLSEARQEWRRQEQAEDLPDQPESQTEPATGGRLEAVAQMLKLESIDPRITEINRIFAEPEQSDGRLKSGHQGTASNRGGPFD